MEPLSIFSLLNQCIAYLTTNYVQPIHEVISVSRNRTIGSSKQNTDCPNKRQTFFPFSLLVYLCAKLKNDKPNDGMTNGFPYKMHIEAKLDYCNYLITIWWRGHKNITYQTRSCLYRRRCSVFAWGYSRRSYCVPRGRRNPPCCLGWQI